MKFQWFLITFHYISISVDRNLCFQVNFPFAGITVVAVGDFLQLPPPVIARPVYAEYKNTWHNLDLLWGLFETAELTEVMRHQGDNNFINLLNHVRIADLDDYDVSISKSRFFYQLNLIQKMFCTFSHKMPQQIFTLSIC